MNSTTASLVDATVPGPDARSLSADALEALRRRAVAAVEAGVTRVEVARLFGVSRKTVGAWVAAYRRAGDDALRPRRRGRRPGEQFALAPAQQAEVIRALLNGTPDAHRLPHRLWTRQAIAELIRREFGILISSPTVSQYLDRWGIIEEDRVLGMRRGRILAGPGVDTGHGAHHEWIDDAEVLWLAWIRPHAPADSPHAAVRGGHNLLTGFRDHFGDVNVLLALTNRGVVYFQAARGPFTPRQADEFVDRLAAHVGRGLNVVVCAWPDRYRPMLREWPRAASGRVSVRFALR